MSNYTQTTFFAPKDLLLSGNPAKLIKGADVDPELANIATAIATKYDATNIASAPVGFAAGTAAAPAVYFSTSTGTGLYQAAANSLGFAANGVAAGAISAAGAWSIPAPSSNVSALTIVGFGGSTPILSLAQNTAGQNGWATISAPSGQFAGFSFAGDGSTFGTTDAIIGQNTDGSMIIGTRQNLPVKFFTDNNVSTPMAQVGLVNASSFQAVDDGGTMQTVGWRDAPQNSQVSVNYTLALSDRGKSVVFGGAGGHTLTIPANASVAFPNGTVILFANNANAATTIAITTDTLTIAGTSTTGSRTVAVNGQVTLYKLAATQWLISGAGLT